MRTTQAVKLRQLKGVLDLRPEDSVHRYARGTGELPAVEALFVDAANIIPRDYVVDVQVARISPGEHLSIGHWHFDYLNGPVGEPTPLFLCTGTHVLAASPTVVANPFECEHTSASWWAEHGYDVDTPPNGTTTLTSGVLYQYDNRTLHRSIAANTTTRKFLVRFHKAKPQNKRWSRGQDGWLVR